MATAKQKIIIKKGGNKNSNKIAISKKSYHISVSKTKDGIITIKKYDYKGDLIYTNTYKEGDTD